MLLFFRDDADIAHPTLIESQPGPASTRPASPEMQIRRHRVRRWLGDEASPKPGVQRRVVSTTNAPDESAASYAHDHFAMLDWDREEFEREMSLDLVSPDLSLGVVEQPQSTAVSSLGSCTGFLPTRFPQQPSVRTSSFSDTRISRRTPTPWPRAVSSASTNQPLTITSNSLTQTSTPPSPSSPSSPSAASPPPPLGARPTSLFATTHRPPHKPSPSVLSLPASHFSSCTSSSGAPSLSSPSLFSQVGRKLVPKFNGGAAVEVSLHPHPRPRRLPVPTSLSSKKRRLIVRGIRIDDDGAVEGIKRWANGLGVVSRITRTPDGTLWIEFQDKRVAENVCCLQAQVQIPNVGRVILDWAEGRHPG